MFHYATAFLPACIFTQLCHVLTGISSDHVSFQLAYAGMWTEELGLATLLQVRGPARSLLTLLPLTVFSMKCWIPAHVPVLLLFSARASAIMSSHDAIATLHTALIATLKPHMGRNITSGCLCSY